MKHSIHYLILVGALLSFSLQAQTDIQYYDDYGNFSTDPSELDKEVAQIFGRFFQTSAYVGSGLYTGNLSNSHAAGFQVGSKFIFFFDRIWAAELGIAWASSSVVYDAENTGVANALIELNSRLIPLSLGLRYAFDREILPRQVAMMNPYFSSNVLLIFRSESVKTADYPSLVGATSISSSVQQDYQEGAVINSTHFGVNFGMGMEFDIYKNKVFLGLDLRYHLVFWKDADVFFGTLGRQGNYATVLGSLAYNY